MKAFLVFAPTMANSDDMATAVVLPVHVPTTTVTATQSYDPSAGPNVVRLCCGSSWIPV